MVNIAQVSDWPDRSLFKKGERNTHLKNINWSYTHITIHVYKIYINYKNIFLIIMKYNLCFHLFIQNNSYVLSGTDYWQILFSVFSCILFPCIYRWENWGSGRLNIIALGRTCNKCPNWNQIQEDRGNYCGTK